jgi:hypothetical protein
MTLVKEQLTPRSDVIVSEGSPRTTVEVKRGSALSDYTIEYDDDRHVYWIDGEEVPSVTTALGVLNKPALPWWGMKVGLEGVVEVIRRQSGSWQLPSTADEWVALLSEHRLTVNHVKDKAGGRGSAVHQALDAYAHTGELPDPSRYAPEQRGYIQSYAAWLIEAKPVVEAAEVIVGSLRHGFAGRFDLRCRFEDGYAEGSWVVDYKTSKKVYESHLIQVVGYELPSVEMGFLPTHGQAVLLLYPDGRKAKWVPSPAKPWHFLAVLEAHKALTDLKRRTSKRRGTR